MDRVYGPNLFTIDERDWKDFEREMPVVVPEPFATIANTTSVKAGQTATVEGIVLELPEGLKIKLNASGEPIYIYASRVTPH